MLPLCSALLLLLAWLQPQHLLPWTGWHSEVLAFVAGLLLWGGVLARSARQSPGRVRLPWISLPWFVLALYAVLQWAGGQIPFHGDALVLVFYCLLAFSVTVAGFEMGLRSAEQTASRGVRGADEMSGWTVLAWCLLAGALLSTAVALAQATDVWYAVDGVSRLGRVRRPGGNLGQPNQLATLQLLGVVSLLYLHVSRRLCGVAAGLVSLVLIAGVGLSESRTGLVGAAAVLAFWLWHRARVFPGMAAWLGCGGMALLLVCFAVLPAGVTWLQEGGASEAMASPNLSAGTRLAVWPQLVEAALEHPWLGWGLGRVSAAHNAVADRYTLAEPFTYAHNIGLDLVLGLGFPLALVLLGGVAVWFLRRLPRSADAPSWYGMALALPLGIHSLLEYPFAYAYFLVPVLFGLGMAEALLAPRRCVNIRWQWLVLPSVLVVVLMGWSALEYVEVEEDFRVVRFEAVKMGETPSDYSRPSIVLLSQMAAMLEASRLQPTPGMDSRQMALAREAALRFPWTALQYRYALALALNGQPQEAVRQLKVMRTLHGERHYQGIRAAWKELADNRYPQLKALELP